MSEDFRAALALRMLRTLPKFGAWAKGVHEFGTPHGRVGFRQVAILWFLRYELPPGENVSPSQIAAYNSVQPSVITRALAKLETSGLIERAIDPDDHRRFQITITEKGMEVSIFIEKLYMDDLRASMAGLDKNQIEELDRSVTLINDLTNDLQERRASHRSGEQEPGSTS